jgi:hypothetical protein
VWLYWVRRRWPVAVFGAVAAVSAVYYAAHYRDGPGWLGFFVALYTATAQGDGRRSLRIVTAGVAALTVVWLLMAKLEPLNAAGWVFFRIGTAIMAAALGESVRTRRVLTAEAVEGAARAERTKEQDARRRVVPSGCGSPGKSTTLSRTPSPSSTFRPGLPPTCWTNDHSKRARCSA